MSTLCLHRPDGVPRSISHVDPLPEIRLLQDSNIDVPLLQILERRLQINRLPQLDVQRHNTYPVCLIQTLQVPTILCLFPTIRVLAYVVAPRMRRSIPTCAQYYPAPTPPVFQYLLWVFHNM